MEDIAIVSIYSLVKVLRNIKHIKNFNLVLGLHIRNSTFSLYVYKQSRLLCIYDLSNSTFVQRDCTNPVLFNLTDDLLDSLESISLKESKDTVLILSIGENISQQLSYFNSNIKLENTKSLALTELATNTQLEFFGELPLFKEMIDIVRTMPYDVHSWRWEVEEGLCKTVILTNDTNTRVVQFLVQKRTEQLELVTPANKAITTSVCISDTFDLYNLVSGFELGTAVLLDSCINIDFESSKIDRKVSIRDNLYLFPSNINSVELGSLAKVLAQFKAAYSTTLTKSYMVFLTSDDKFNTSTTSDFLKFSFDTRLDNRDAMWLKKLTSKQSLKVRFDDLQCWLEIPLSSLFHDIVVNGYITLYRQER